MASKKKATKKSSKKAPSKAERLEKAGKFIREKIQQYIADGGSVKRGLWGAEVIALEKDVLSDEYGVKREVYDFIVTNEDDDEACALGALLHVAELTPEQKAKALESDDLSVEYLAALATGMTTEEVNQFISGFDAGDTSSEAAKLGNAIAIEFLGDVRECPACGENF